MISSTARDLPEHRKVAMDACLRQGFYLGILAFAIGTCPKGHTTSITEVEDHRASHRTTARR